MGIVIEGKEKKSGKNVANSTDAELGGWLSSRRGLGKTEELMGERVCSCIVIMFFS